MKRRQTRTVRIGDIKIGSGHPVAIQSMTKVPTEDPDAVVAQIRQLEKAGGDIARVAVKTARAAENLAFIQARSTIPVVADIHFDPQLALKAIDSGVCKIRINPGNISRKQDLAAIAGAAARKRIPVRIGVNSGSLNDTGRGQDLADSMVRSALECADILQKAGLEQMVISLKSASVPQTVRAVRELARRCDIPVHLGVTAAGPPEEGIIRSSLGIGSLLLDGIGDTIRVSLTGDPAAEVETAKRILSAAESRQYGHRLISCPTCGRCQVDLRAIVDKVNSELKNETGIPENKQMVIAVMGCEVNGPGEASHADAGIAFGRGTGALFRKGRKIKTVPVSQAVDELIKLIREE